MTAVVDYGAGNLPSVGKAVRYLGFECVTASDPAAVATADTVILPGVGAFPAAMRMLSEKGLDAAVKKAASEKPLLGICLGMQMLFGSSDEFCETDGLGLIPGRVTKICAPGLKIPHMGWNSLEITQPSPLFCGVDSGAYVYFVHSFAAATDGEYVSAYTDYGGKVTASAQNGYAFGTQFHPEKSGEVGLAILKNFLMLGGKR